MIGNGCCSYPMLATLYASSQNKLGTVLLKELHCAFPVWVTHSMTGCATYWEHDIDNSYWKLDNKLGSRGGSDSGSFAGPKTSRHEA